MVTVHAYTYGIYVYKCTEIVLGMYMHTGAFLVACSVAF